MCAAARVDRHHTRNNRVFEYPVARRPSVGIRSRRQVTALNSGPHAPVSGMEKRSQVRNQPSAEGIPKARQFSARRRHQNEEVGPRSHSPCSRARRCTFVGEAIIETDVWNELSRQLIRMLRHIHHFPVRLHRLFCPPRLMATLMPDEPSFPALTVLNSILPRPPHNLSLEQGRNVYCMEFILYR